MELKKFLKEKEILKQELIKEVGTAFAKFEKENGLYPESVSIYIDRIDNLGCKPEYYISDVSISFGI